MSKIYCTHCDSFELTDEQIRIISDFAFTNGGKITNIIDMLNILKPHVFNIDKEYLKDVKKIINDVKINKLNLEQLKKQLQNNLSKEQTKQLLKDIGNVDIYLLNSEKEFRQISKTNHIELWE